jgi:hypothetical protein
LEKNHHVPLFMHHPVCTYSLQINRQVDFISDGVKNKKMVVCEFHKDYKLWGVCHKIFWLILRLGNRKQMARTWPALNGSVDSVTGLGEFFTIGRNFAYWAIVYIRSFLKITEVGKKLGYSLPRNKLWINFDIKWVGPHLGRFFQKLIWSPCS